MALLIPAPETSRLFSNPNPSPRAFRFPANDKKSSVRVCSGVKTSSAEFDRNSTPYGKFSAAAAAAEVKPSKGDEEKQEFYVNMGYAIRTLREELPELFFRELSFGIYRDDITFKDPMNTFTGIENYKAIFSALRFHGQIFFKALWLDLISVSQPTDNVIMVRWTIHGVPRVLWESRGRFDGTSEYKLDKKGKIYEHRVNNIALNSPPKFQMLAVSDIMQSLGCPSTPKPTFFETSPSPSSERS